MFLENEIWVWCPVKSSFSMMKLHEFKFLRNSKLKINTKQHFLTVKQNGDVPPPRPPPPFTEQKKPKLVINQFILNLFEFENPFNLKNQLKKTTTETSSSSADNLSTPINDTNSHYNTDSDDDSDYSDEFDDSNSTSLSDSASSASSVKIISKHNGNGTSCTDSIKTNSNQLFANIPNKMKIPIVTNTTLNVIRLFGKYLHMLDTFEIISSDVINYMMQLFNFYFYYIYFNFAKREVSSKLFYVSLLFDF